MFVRFPDSTHRLTSCPVKLSLVDTLGRPAGSDLCAAYQNHETAIALHYMHYNYCRIHSSLRVTPAMEAGVANHVWSIEEVIALLVP